MDRLGKRRIVNTCNIICGKWSINILADMFMGNKRFTGFLENNPELSTKMLAQRLVQLQKSGLVKKKYNKRTFGHDYVLTEKGLRTHKILFEMAKFSFDAVGSPK